MKLESPAFSDNARIPKRYTGDGEDVSPPLRWDNVPQDTMEFALVCLDPDAPGPQPFLHWLVTGIPGIRRSLTEATSAGGFPGTNDFGHNTYNGPLPPEGHGEHHYVFKLYALDECLSTGNGTSLEDATEAMKGHVLDTAECVGTYERN